MATDHHAQAEAELRRRLSELIADLTVFERRFANHPHTMNAIAECRRQLELERREIKQSA